MKPRLILFDIDQTLIHGGGCGRRALQEALRKVFGLAKALDSIPMSGRTDTAIVLEVFKRQRIKEKNFREKEELLWDHYVLNLKRELSQSSEARIEQGIPEILTSLCKSPLTHLALLTGNIRKGAQAKLGHFGLWDYFPVGAFGDDHLDRNVVAQLALRRCAKYYKTAFLPENTYVVGDSPNDVHAARAIGARAVMVATGIHPYELLQNEKPFALFHDFSKTKAVLESLQGKPYFETNYEMSKPVAACEQTGERMRSKRFRRKRASFEENTPFLKSLDAKQN